MREILFRGKREDTKAWVEGYLIEQNSPEYHAYIIQSFKAEIDDRHIDILECDIYEVIPETVGWCTGLRDKNGTRLFEGDIIRNIDNSDIGAVRWYSEHGSFMIRRISDNQIFWLFDNDFSKIEVIGNIYDNPELLKEVAQNGG